MKLAALTGQRVYLDANVIIYAVQSHPPWSTPAGLVFDAIGDGRIEAVTSELSIAEVLPKPFECGDQLQVDTFIDLLTSGDGLTVGPIGRDILVKSAQLRALSNLKLLDAIHVATAQIMNCSLFLSQDERLGRMLSEAPKWLRLSDVTA